MTRFAACAVSSAEHITRSLTRPPQNSCVPSRGRNGYLMMRSSEAADDLARIIHEGYPLGPHVRRNPRLLPCHRHKLRWRRLIRFLRPNHIRYQGFVPLPPLFPAAS
jgi:hypothetical protein